LCAREKRAIASLDKHMERGCFESRIGCVTVGFPAAIEQIYLDAARNWVAAIYSNCGITKIRSGLPIPGAELDNFDLISAGADKMFAEVSGKPARLQLQLGRNSRRHEQGAFTHASHVTHLHIALYERAHPRIMRSACANVTSYSSFAAGDGGLYNRAMLDIRLVREKPDYVRERLASRGGGDEAKIDEVLGVDAERSKS